MERGLKRSLTRTVQRLEHRQERYGSTSQQAPTVRSAAQLKLPWRRSCLDGWRKAMISFRGSLKIFLLVDCCDMRKGFNALHGLVSSSFGDDPRSGALYVFCNRRHTRIKILYFDGTGLWVLSKRLERGTFSWPNTAW
jgi:transposase